MSKSRKTPSASWELAARLCEIPTSGLGKAETILDQYVKSICSRDRRHCQRLFYASVRHARLIDTTVRTLVARPPRSRLAGLLRAALADILESRDDKYAQVVDFWVGKTREVLSKGEAGLVNAVLRRAPAYWASPEVADHPALRLSHPEWLAQGWATAYGQEAAEALMEWNQQPAEVFLRMRVPMDTLPAGCITTAWSGFLKWTGEGDWAEIEALLAQGAVYAQDPGTRLAPALLNVQLGEQVLDLCAAPGGKSLLLAEALGEDDSGLLVCVDVPGSRINQLDENLRKLASTGGPDIQLLAADLRDLKPEDTGLFDAVLLDAPCSNTGVIRRRPDVKWRLGPASVGEMAALQGVLLTKAAELLRPGGRMVYSTCSIEPDENEAVVAAFLKAHPGFILESGQTHRPSMTGHDGAGCFLLSKS